MAGKVDFMRLADNYQLFVIVRLPALTLPVSNGFQLAWGISFSQDLYSEGTKSGETMTKKKEMYIN